MSTEGKREQDVTGAHYMQSTGEGVCFAHGPYKNADRSANCPKWPACITDPQKPEFVNMGMSNVGARIRKRQNSTSDEEPFVVECPSLAVPPEDKSAEPVWKKCPQCGRENSVETWDKLGGKCPNCNDLHTKESAPEPPSQPTVAEKIAAVLRICSGEDQIDCLEEDAVLKAIERILKPLAGALSGAAPSEQLKHTRSCPALTPGNEEDCTCGLRWRIALQTEQTMHTAWRKRAEEAEAKLASVAAVDERAEPTVDDALRLIRKIEACSSNPAKLILLKNFISKFGTASNLAAESRAGRVPPSDEEAYKRGFKDGFENHKLQEFMEKVGAVPEPQKEDL